MKFGILQRIKEINISSYINSFFIFGVLIISIIFAVYVLSFQSQAKKEASIVPNLVNQFMYYSGHDNFEHILTNYILHNIIAKIDFPIIITNSEQEPVFWKNIDIDEMLKYYNLPIELKDKLNNDLSRMKKKNQYIPLYSSPDDPTVLGYTFYDDSRIIKWLKLLPIAEVFFAALFIFIWLYSISYLRKNEKQMIWTGLAKETAHQFGTPISSLIGWIDFLRIKIENNPQKEELNSIFNDMNHDVEILKKVASRFGKVGSNIALIPSDIDEIIMDTIEYYKKRLPNDNNKIKMIYKTLNPKTILNIDKELFSWAIENIIRNCIDAMKNKKGVIKIQSYRQEESFFILIKDQGEGIKKSMLKSIFEPGVTTKERGWGLGLSLTKRIIEEYHNGKVKVLDSSAKQGTTIEITLPYNFEIIKKGI